MAQKRNYECSYCGRVKHRDDLLVKRLQYTEMGTNGKVRQSRVLAWVCTFCLDRDFDFHRPAMTTAPGFKGTKLWQKEDQPNGSDPHHDFSKTGDSLPM